MELDNHEYSLSFVDACPNDIFYSNVEQAIIITQVNFFKIPFENTLKIPQYKNAKGIDRKLKWINHIINKVQNGEFRLIVYTMENNSRAALYSAKVFLLDNKFVSDTNIELSEKIYINNKSISFGKLLCLSWYAISLVSLSHFPCSFAKYENKNMACILLDLIQGDSIASTDNLEILNYIIENSELKSILLNNQKEKEIKKFGFAYGRRESGTSELKKEIPYVLTDWITHSLYQHYINSYSVVNEKNIKIQQIANLAKFLINEGLIKETKNIIVKSSKA